MITFRKADHIDIPTLSNLYERTYDEAAKKHTKFDIKTIQDEFYKGYITHLMYDIKKRIPWLIGAHSFLLRKPDTIYVSHIAVLPEFQRQGYARKLMDHREALMTKVKGVKFLEYYITDALSKGVQQFYETYGYKIIKEFTLNGSKVLKGWKKL